MLVDEVAPIVQLPAVYMSTELNVLHSLLPPTLESSKPLGIVPVDVEVQLLQHAKERARRGPDNDIRS